MAGSCAVCLQPIATGDKFLVAGTEVFHRACAQTRGTQPSIGNRRHARLVELEGQVRQQDLEIRRLQAHLGDLAHKESGLLRLVADLRALRDEYKSQRDLARRDRDTAAENRDIARRERNDLAGQLATLTGELAALRALGPAPVSASQTQADPAPADTGKDDTEQRFSLLELD